MSDAKPYTSEDVRAWVEMRWERERLDEQTMARIRATVEERDALGARGVRRGSSAGAVRARPRRVHGHHRREALVQAAGQRSDAEGGPRAGRREGEPRRRQVGPGRLHRRRLRGLPLLRVGFVMKVSELIAKLKKFDGDLPVRLAQPTSSAGRRTEAASE